MKKVKTSNLVLLAIFAAIITVSIFANKSSVKMLVYKFENKISLITNN